MSRKEYDKNRSDYKQSGTLEDATTYFGEEFDENAWDSDDDDDDGDEVIQEEDPDTTPKKPDDFRLAIYRQATEFVNSFLNGDGASRSKIQEFNDQIDAQNKRDQITGKEEFFIQDRVLKGLKNGLKAALGHHQTNPDEEKPVETIIGLEEQLEKTKRMNSYPDDWILPVPEEVRSKMQQVRENQAKRKVAWQNQFGGASGPSASPSSKEDKKAQSQESAAGTAAGPSNSSQGQTSASSKDKGKGRAQSTGKHGRGESSKTSSNQGNDKDKGRAHGTAERHGGASSSSAQTPGAVSAWRPGLTEQGEKILGVAPHEVDAVGGRMANLRCKFVVEKKGRTNPIEFEDDVDLGDRAACGYLDQPKSEQVDIRTKMNAYSRKDQKGFDRILGITPVYSDSTRIFPPIAIWARWNDDSRKLMNRTGFRDIWKSRADRMIEDFFVNIGDEIPWAKEAQRPGHVKAIEYHETRKTHADAYKIRERSRHRDLRRRPTFDADRRRSLSRSSGGGLSDEGLRRLDTMEGRQKVVNKQLQEMRLDYESSNADLGMKMAAMASQLDRMMSLLSVRG